MKNNQIVINTLVLQHQHENGQTQIQLVDQLINAGIWNIEVRREYFKHNLREMEALNHAKLGKRLTLFYSVPDVLFVDGEINSRLTQYFSEALLFGASYVKLNIGDFGTYKGDLKKEIEAIQPKNVQLDVENDQTVLNGSADNILAFLQSARKDAVDIGFVNDLGNWIFTKQDAVQASQKLSSFTRYIHIKNYVLKGDKAETVSIDQGLLDWKKLLDLNDPNLPVALEYPVDTMDNLKTDIGLLENYLESRQTKS